MAAGSELGVESESKSQSKKFDGKEYIMMPCILTVMGGLMYGYNIGISSSGVISISAFLQEYLKLDADNYNSNKLYCKLKDDKLKFSSESLNMAASVASLLVSDIPLLFAGRECIIVVGFIFLVGTSINSCSQPFSMLISGTILMGISSGISTKCGIELSAYNYSKDIIYAIYQLAVPIGILLAYLVDYFSPKIEERSWQYCLGGAMIPAACIFLLATIIVYHPEHFPDSHPIVRKAQVSAQGPADVPHLQKMFSLFHRMSAMTTMMYAPFFFKTIGLQHHISLLFAGIVNVAATSFAFIAIVKFGRRKLLLSGGILLFFSKVLLATILWWKFGEAGGDVNDLPRWCSNLVFLLFICIYISGFAWSWELIGWLAPDENIPPEIHFSVEMVVNAVNWSMTMAVFYSFLKLCGIMRPKPFISSAKVVTVITAFIYFFFPETNRGPHKEISGAWKQHWFWKRFMSLKTKS